MKNYYEILQVSENASQEVIEKIYKFLAKKYHPDLNADNLEQAEEKFKELSEAYETLSDPEQRKIYDEELKIEEEQQQIQKENELINKIRKEIVLSYEIENSENMRDNKNYQEQYDDNIEKQRMEDEYYRNLQNYNVKKAYNDAYVDALRNMGVEVEYKKTFGDYFRIFRVIFIIIVILVIIWNIPAVNEKIVEIYNQSGIFKDVIDVIIGSANKIN